ncbi:High-affinity branched-chain amino acid transport ATP-binding protein BraG [Burkholderiales bacterium]|nr:High-affinity branched-chain amino acid transport ATP-binding protein BraG [Burkholderiales bacterium]
MLRVENLHAFYGKSHVLHGVDLHVGAGEIVSLLGRNGVGRSTTARSIMGLVSCCGTIEFRERPLVGLTPFEIARQGLGYVPESRDVFPGLTVEQNLKLGMKKRVPGKWGFEDSYRLFPCLRERRDAHAGVLSGGEQQMLALARTMMGDPQLAIIDEPTEGLAPLIVEQIARFLQDLRARQVAVLLVEQKLQIALRISQRIYVMGHGRVVFEGSPAELKARDDVRREWLEV